MSGGSLAAPAPKPGEDMLGEFGDLFGNAQMVFELLQKIKYLLKNLQIFIIKTLVKSFY